MTTEPTPVTATEVKSSPIDGDDRVHPPLYQARRECLPFSTKGKPVLPNQTVEITSRPQRVAFRPERLFVSGFTPRLDPIGAMPIVMVARMPWYRRWFSRRSPELEAQLRLLNEQTAMILRTFDELNNRSMRGASDWLIEDIMIGNRSQLAQSGALPGDMFATGAIDSFISFETAQTAMDVKLIVTYRGPCKSGVEFVGSMLGTSTI